MYNGCIPSRTIGDRTTQRVTKSSRADSREPPRPWLMVIADGLFATHPLPERGHIVIGRGAGADVRIDHPSISRKHARLDVGALTIEDLGSANGTRIKQRPLAPHQPAPFELS